MYVNPTTNFNSTNLKLIMTQTTNHSNNQRKLFLNNVSLTWKQNNITIVSIDDNNNTHTYTHMHTRKSQSINKGESQLCFIPSWHKTEKCKNRKKNKITKQNASMINLMTKIKTKAWTKTIIPPKKQQTQTPKCMYKVKAIHTNVHSYTYIYTCTHIMMPTQLFQN